MYRVPERYEGVEDQAQRPDLVLHVALVALVQLLRAEAVAVVSAVALSPFPWRAPQAGQHPHPPVVDLFLAAVELVGQVPVALFTHSPAGRAATGVGRIGHGRVLELRRRRSHVNRTKMLKRQLFGRAGFALLRTRVLLAP